MPEKGITEKEAEEREKLLLERDTRNILLGSFMSIFSSLITLLIFNYYLKPSTTAAAAIAEYQKRIASPSQPTLQPNKLSLSSLSTYKWEPLSDKEIKDIHNIIEYGY